MKAVRRDAPVPCPVCGRSVERRARQQRFCSAQCKEKGRTRVRKNFLGRDTGAPTNPPKKSRNVNNVQGAKSGSRGRISGPARVIAIECFDGREWTQTVSTDGVACEVGVLRPPMLRAA
jgi:hypothetical protein